MTREHYTPVKLLDVPIDSNRMDKDDLLTAILALDIALGREDRPSGTETYYRMIELRLKFRRRIDRMRQVRRDRRYA